MASVMTSLLVTLVVFVQFVEFTLGGCVFDPICSKSSDCLNGGTCFQNVCHCTEFYIGDHCETAFQCKRDADCLNNGKCTNCSPGFKATCDCALDYIGANCAFKYSCDKKKCGDCETDFTTETTAETTVAPTTESTTKTTSETEITVAMTTESTTETTTETETTVAPTTEQMTTPMSPNCRTSSDCQNGGTCYMNVCHCTDHYIGDNCETAFQCEKDADCQNNGVCPGITEACDCASGFVGANCALMYNCDTRNPCFDENTTAHGFYFEVPNPHNYIQCDNNKRCFPKSCGVVLVYKPATHVCDYAK